VLRVEDVVVGEPGAGEARLRIHAIGLNRTELTLRSGRLPVKPTLPSPIGFEAAGVIDALGPNVSGFSVGDRVALVPAYSASQYGLYGEASLARVALPALARGALRPTIARTFAFDDIADAHRFIERGEQIGKIVVTV
jgi:NADPH:quinone reductase-like Zn-dependent oxidoreductase